MPGRRWLVVPSPPLRALRPHRVLRLVPLAARESPCSRRAPSGHPKLRAGRRLVLGLRARGRFRRSRPCLTPPSPARPASAGTSGPRSVGLAGETALTVAGPGRGDADEAWPRLPWRDWGPTMDTLHMWVQIVGKVRMALAPPLNHWWHVPLYASARGLTTTTIPSGQSVFQVDFDFVDHRLIVADSDGGVFAMPLEPMSVARFHVAFMAGLRDLGVDVRISTKPVEVAEAIPFEADETHGSYDQAHAHAFWRGLLQADRVHEDVPERLRRQGQPGPVLLGKLRPRRRAILGATRSDPPGRRAQLSRLGHGRGLLPRGEQPRLVACERAAWSGVLCVHLPRARRLPVCAGPSDGSRLRPASGRVHPAVRCRPRPGRPGRGRAAFFQSTYEAGAELAGWDRAPSSPESPRADLRIGRGVSAILPYQPRHEAARVSVDPAHRHRARRSHADAR